MLHQINQTEIILYVQSQEASRDFYRQLFRQPPDLDVTGMTEFHISETCKLGLMPAGGIAKILAGKTPHPETGKGIPRCELYFYVTDLDLEYQNALKAGALLVSPPADRNWGDRVCYLSDPDGHIIAFAAKTIHT